MNVGIKGYRITENAELDAIALAADRRRRFTLYEDLQAASNKLWLVKGLLGEREVSTVYGAPGCGKSVLIEDMALHIAAGLEWFGRPVKLGSVVYVALERAALVERRAIAFRNKHDEHDVAFALVRGVHDFREMGTAQYMADICREVMRDTGCPVGLIVIDTLSRAMCGGDENSAKDMGAVVATAAKLQEMTKAHVMFVHHMPHETDRMRGHGALLGAMDTTIHVTKGSGARTATVVKANDSEEGESVAFTLESVVIGTDGTTAPVVVPLDSALAKPSGRPMKPEDKLALEALDEVLISGGTAAPGALGLPGDIRVASVDAWRNELYRRDIVDKSRSNPPQQFKRIWERLAAMHAIGLRDGVVWRARA